MDARVLQRLRRKVNRGECLTEAELRRLRTTSDVEGGSALGIVLGLALSNAGANAEALSVLEALGDTPDPSLLQARARALVWAERTEEAERVLVAGASAHPRDVELRKSLAILALRRGDRALAERVLAEARELAPGDAEARELAEGLAAADAGGSTLEVLLEGSRQGAWTGFWPAPRWEHGGLRATWTDEDAEATPHDVLAHVVPVLAVSADGEGLTREGPAGLVVSYVADGLAIPAGRRDSPDLERVDGAAWKRLEQHVAEPRPVIVDRGRPRLSPEALGLWALCEADGADGARLLTRAQRRRLFEVVGPGPYRVSLARRELALVAPLLDPGAVASLESLEPGPDGVPGRFALQPDGTLQQLAAAP
jgi:hypothetical protein